MNNNIVLKTEDGKIISIEFNNKKYEYSTDSLIFVTVAGDFRDVPAGGDKLYGTKRLIVEVFHQ